MCKGERVLRNAMLGSSAFDFDGHETDPTYMFLVGRALPFHEWEWLLASCKGLVQNHFESSRINALQQAIYVGYPTQRQKTNPTTKDCIV